MRVTETVSNNYVNFARVLHTHYRAMAKYGKKSFEDSWAFEEEIKALYPATCTVTYGAEMRATKKGTPSMDWDIFNKDGSLRARHIMLLLKSQKTELPYIVVSRKPQKQAQSDELKAILARFAASSTTRESVEEEHPDSIEGL